MTPPISIAIIGAGPAGSAAAFHLARAGLGVTIFEARPFPRVKVCGEFVSPAATHLLEAILPADALLAAGARRARTFVLQHGNRARALPLPTPAWAISRRSLDALLLERAADAGARVVQPAPIVSVDHGSVSHPDRARLTLADGRCAQADLVLHADGHARFCPSGPTPGARGLLGHKCHFIPDAPIEGVTIRSCRGAYLGTIQIETHERTQPRHATIALVARASLLGVHGGDRDAMVRALWPEWNPARRTTDWFSCAVARSPYRPSGHFRALALGNAAAAVDPVGGEGIGLALWSGTRAATLIANATRGSSL